jgi:hypothetical protein
MLLFSAWYDGTAQKDSSSAKDAPGSVKAGAGTRLTEESRRLGFCTQQTTEQMGKASRHTYAAY